MVSIKSNKNYINSYLNLKEKKFKVRYHDVELHNILKKLITHKKQNILDLGCGNGGSTIYLQKKFPQNYFYGIDYKKKIFIKKKNKYPIFINYNLLKNIKLDLKFDIIYSKAVIQTLPEKQLNKVFSNVNKMLKKDGIFIIFDCFHNFKEYEIFNIEYIRNEKSKNPLKKFNFFYLSKKNLKQRLIKSKFKNINFYDFFLNFEVRKKNETSQTLRLKNNRILSLLGPIIQPWCFVISKKK